MKGNFDEIDELLEKTCYVIDILPERVSQDSDGQYFDVEYYLLNSNKHHAIKDKFVNVILKIMCYYNVPILWDKWIEKPDPEMIDEIVSTIMENHSGTLNIIMTKEDSLLVFDWDCIYLAAYNLNEEMISLMEKIALSEGLFMRKSDT